MFLRSILTSASRVAVLLALTAATSAAQAPVPTAEPAPAPQITNVRGDLYRVQVGTQQTVFLVTSDGIILSDPMNRSTAAWLRRELAERFPGLRVRYVLLTHHHFDRAEGAWLFKPEARLVGQARFNDALKDARQVLPFPLTALDRNHNHKLDGPELAGLDAAMLEHDEDGNGELTPDELYRRVGDVDDTFKSHRETLRLGSAVVEMVRTGPAHAVDMTALSFPSERIVFASGIPPVTSKPFAFGEFRPADVLAWLHALVPLAFDTLLTDSGETIPRADLVALTEYLEAVSAGVRVGFKAGESVQTLQTDLTLPVYAASPHYAGREALIGELYRRLRLIKADAIGGGVVHATPGKTTYCDEYTTCVVPGAGLPGATRFTIIWMSASASP